MKLCEGGGLAGIWGTTSSGPALGTNWRWVGCASLSNQYRTGTSPRRGGRGVVGGAVVACIISSTNPPQVSLAPVPARSSAIFDHFDRLRPLSTRHASLSPPSSCDALAFFRRVPLSIVLRDRPSKPRPGLVLHQSDAAGQAELSLAGQAERALKQAPCLSIMGYGRHELA